MIGRRRGRPDLGDLGRSGGRGAGPGVVGDGSLAMATEGEGALAQGAAPKGKAKKPISPARNAIGLVLLVAFSTVAFLEWDANRKANAAIQKLEKAVEGQEDGLLSMDEVQKMIGRAPDGPGSMEKGEKKVTYTWRGVIRRRVLTAFYTPEVKMPHLRHFSTE
jgi:hypothetical protein